MKEFAPVRIWATVNGASTRLPDGARQFIGGWSEDSQRPGATEYVRADSHALLIEALESIQNYAKPSALASTDTVEDLKRDLRHIEAAARRTLTQVREAGQ